MPTNFKQCDVFQYLLRQIGVLHGCAAVFDDDGFSKKPLYIGQRLDQHVCPLDIFYHYFLLKV